MPADWSGRRRDRFRSGPVRFSWNGVPACRSGRSSGGPGGPPAGLSCAISAVTVCDCLVVQVCPVACPGLSCRVVQTRQARVGPTRARAPTRVGPTRPVFVQDVSSDKTKTRQTSCRRRSVATPSHRVLCGRPGRVRMAAARHVGSLWGFRLGFAVADPYFVRSCLARWSAAGLVRLSRLVAGPDSRGCPDTERFLPT